MKKLVVTLFVVLFFSGLAFSQPTLTIVTETPGLPSELFYGSVKVKPVRMRPPGATYSPPYWCVGAANTPITIDDCDFFTQQQYIDFLRRFPEAGLDGQYGTSDDPLRFYLNILGGCNPNDLECNKYTRGAISANFFRSPEFANKGIYVANLFNVALGQRPKTVDELNDATKIERPTYIEFMADLASISTPNDDPVLTNQKKDQLAVNFLTRTDVINKLGYTPGMTRSEFVTKLESVAGLTLTNRDALIGSSMTHAQILRAVAEATQVADKFYVPTFITMEYMGYQRRAPEDCHSSSNQSECGLIYHYRRFNELLPQLGSDLTQNFLVRGFIESPEYRGRF